MYYRMIFTEQSKDLGRETRQTKVTALSFHSLTACIPKSGPEEVLGPLQPCRPEVQWELVPPHHLM